MYVGVNTAFLCGYLCSSNKTHMRTACSQGGPTDISRFGQQSLGNMTKAEARDAYIRVVDSLFPNTFRNDIAEAGIQLGVLLCTFVACLGASSWPWRYAVTMVNAQSTEYSNMLEHVCAQSARQHLGNTSDAYHKQ